MPATYPEDISTEHPFYENNIGDWELVYAAFNGGSDFINSDYMVQHVFESDSEFERRIERAMYFNIMRRTITQLVRMIMAEGVIRDGTEELAQVIDDATGFGTPWNAFFQDAGITSAMYGNAHIIVDYAVSEEDTEIRSMYDIEAAGVYPTLELFTPMELINWKRKRRRGYEWCVFKTQRVVEGEDTEVFIKVDYEQIAEVDKDGNNITEPYDHGLGFTPVVDVPFPGIHKRDLQRGLGVDLAYVSKSILNMSSLAEEVAERHAFNQLTMPDDGAIEEMQARQSDYMSYDVAPEVYNAMSQGIDPTLLKLSRSTAMTFPAGTGHPPGFISPDSSQLKDIWGVVKDAIALALYSAGVAEMGGKLDMTTMSATLTDLSAVMQQAENTAFRMVDMYMGSGGAEDIAVVYPSSFSLDSFDNWLKNFQSMTGIQNINDEFLLEILRGMVLKMPGHLSQVDKSRMAATLQIEQPEPENEGNNVNNGGSSPDGE